jgi:hypothetical protein
MITIYKNKKDIPEKKELVLLNDVFFNKKTVDQLDKRAEKIIDQIDGATVVGKYRIKSRFHQIIIDIDKLSTGCKTVLNVIYNPDKVFYIAECGENAIDLLYELNEGSVYCEFPTISFDMQQVCVSSNGKCDTIDDYEELKEWWEHEE